MKAASIIDDQEEDEDVHEDSGVAKKGHNVSEATKSLASLIKRIERLEEEKKAFVTDIREVYVEAKNKGYDVKVMREIIKRRRRDKADVEEFDAVLATYETSLDSILE